MLMNFYGGLQVKPDKVNLIIGSGGKKVKSIIEETGVESIDTQDNGIVSLEDTLSSNGVFDAFISLWSYILTHFCR